MQSVDSLALDSLTLYSLALDSLTLDSLAVDSLAVDSLALDSLALYSLALDSHTPFVLYRHIALHTSQTNNHITGTKINHLIYLLNSTNPL